MMIPGLIMVLLFLGYIAVQGALFPPTPQEGDPEEEQFTLSEKLWATVTTMVPVFLLIFAVLGSILGGIASPTEAAAVGAAGALVLCIANRRFDAVVLRDSLAITVRISAMILLIVAAGTMFMGVFAANGGARLIRDFIEGAGWGPRDDRVLLAGGVHPRLRAGLDSECADLRAVVHALHPVLRH